MEFGKSGHDAWILALDSTGTPLWQNVFGGKLDDDLTALAATPDGPVFVAASRSAFDGAPVTFNRPWIVRLDTAGEPIVQRTFNYSSGDVMTDIVALDDGTFATTGEIGAMGFFRGDVWVQRLDAGLNILWDQRFGDSFLNYVDSGRRVRPLPNGDLLVAASTGTSGAGSEDLWLLQLDGAGELVADRTFGGTGFDNGLALAIDPSGMAFLGGIVQPDPNAGSFEVFLARITPQVMFKPASADCPPSLPTQPNIWTSPLTIGSPLAIPVASTIVPQVAVTTRTALSTHSFSCN